MITPATKTIFLTLYKKPEEERVGGIIVPGAEEATQDRGEVVFVGEGCWVKPGQQIIFKHYESHEVEIDRKKYVVIRDQDVLAVIA